MSGALAAFWGGAFGSWDAFTGDTLARAVPLILIGLGFALAFRAGAINIGGEGQFYAGAIAATALGLHAGASGVSAPAVALVAAGIAGAVWIAVPVWLRLRFGVLEVISTLLLNYVAESLVSNMVEGPLQEHTHIYPQSDPIADAARLPFLPGTRLHLGFAIAVVLALALAWAFARTVWGFRLLATGLGPRAAAVSGRIPISRVTGTALLLSGALAGLAGGVEVTGVSYALYLNLSPGYGFTAIAVALLGRGRPGLIVLSGVLFGALESGALAMQRDAGVPAVAVYVIEALVIVGVLLAERGTRQARLRLAGEER
jgi:simple sugar transport system permease protein